MSTMAIVFCGTHPFGQHLGDTIVAIKTAWVFAQNEPCDKYLLVLSPGHDLEFLWDKFRDTHPVEVIYDSFDAGNADIRFDTWNKWIAERQIEGHPFDHYRELYRRIDGGHRQGVLCANVERGLGRKNIFEYFAYGQENCPEFVIGAQSFRGPDLFYSPPIRPLYDVLLAPYAKCQGNRTFTFQFWDAVVRGLIAAGKSVSVNYDRAFCDDLIGNPLFRKVYPSMQDLQSAVCMHRVVTCGNTGVGWMAAVCGAPLLAMQPVDSHIQDYRYEWCGVESLIEYLDEPDPESCVSRLVEECNRALVLTTGCYDILHAGHVRHLEESRQLGNRLIVALNSDASVKRLKGADRPFQKEEDRVALLRALRCVDEVIVFDGDATSLIQELRPNVLTNGSDHKPEEVVGRALVESYGGRVVITGGARQESTTTIARKVLAHDVMRVVREAEALSINPPHKLCELAKQALSVAEVPGSFADVGTYKGACGLILRRLAPERVLHLFDTWTGNPHNDDLCHHKRGEWPADLAAAKAVLAETELTRYHVGVFPETAAELNGEQFAFVYVDGDTYQTTRDAIEFFWPRLAPGGKLMFDDVPWTPCAGTEKAINEAFAPERQLRIASACACVVTK